MLRFMPSKTIWPAWVSMTRRVARSNNFRPRVCSINTDDVVEILELAW
jgi:hypothetical protein